MRLGAGLALALAVGLGLSVRLLRDDCFDFHDRSYFSFKQAAEPGLYHADEPLLRADNTGFYMFAPHMLGRLLRPLGREDLQLQAVAVLQTFLWSVQIFFFFLLARKVSGDPWGAVLATLLFAWGTPLLRVIDAPTEPHSSLGRSLGYALVMPSIYAYFSGRKWPAWLLGAVAIYIHGSPAVHLMMLYFMVDAWSAARGREPMGELLKRLLAAVLLLAPFAWHEFRTGPIPDKYLATAYEMIIAYPAVPAYVMTDWLLFAQGILFIALAWRKRASPSEVARLSPSIFFFSGCLFFLAWFSRAVIFPNRLPLGAFLMKLTAAGAYLFLAELIGVILVGHYLARGFQEEKDRNFPLYLLLYALMLSNQFDYVTRMIGLFVMIFRSDRVQRAARLTGDQARMVANALLGVVFGTLLMWQWCGDGAAELWRRFFHLGGTIFALPAFQKTTLVIWAAAYLMALALRGLRFKWTMPVVTAFLCVLPFYVRPSSAQVSRVSPLYVPPGSAYAPQPSWVQTMDWVKTHTRTDSYIMIPPEPGGSMFEFMIQTCRAAFTLTVDYPMMLCGYGAVAVPLAQRLEDLGYDYSCCRMAWESDIEVARAYAALDAGRIRALAEKYGLTHIIVREPNNPVRSLNSVYRNGPFKIYSLQDARIGGRGARSKS